MTTLEARYERRIADFRDVARLEPVRRLEVERLRGELAAASHAAAAVGLGSAAGGAAEARLRDAEAALAESVRASEDEMRYMLDAIPFIKEYNAGGEDAPRAAHVPGTLDGFVVVTTSTNRNNVLQRYLADVEKLPEARTQVEIAGRRASAGMVCRRCDEPLLLNAREAEMVCTSCGTSVTYMDMSSACLTYDETWSRDIVSSFAYKRMNHFTEWLNALQAKENTEIPEAVIEAVKAEFKKTRATTRGEIRPTRVREFLKKLKLNKWYEHVHTICNALNGCPAPKLPPALEDRLKAMFAEIQAPFEKHCPPTRKNFLSYSYVLSKMCELLGEDQYLPYFPLLKSSEKLYLQDQIWRNICRELGWEFIRSV